MADDKITDTRNPALEPNPDKGTSILGMTFGDDTEEAGRQIEERDAAQNAPAPSVDTPEPFQAVLTTETDKGISANGMSFTGNLGHEIDNGLGTNLAGLVQDYANAEPESEELFFELAEKADKLTEQYGWDSTITDELLSDVQSVEELERKAKRVAQYQADMASLDNTSMTQQLIAGFGGFVLDPVNLIPGAAIIRGGNAAAKVFPRIANSLTKTSVGKTGTYAAMGAIEEAARNYPRLMNDPVYSYEMYKLDVAIGAGFGGGLAAVMPGGKLALSKVSEGVQKAVNKYKTSQEARMAVNTLTDTLGVTKNPAAKKAVQDAIDAAADSATVKAAKKAADYERAREQVDTSTVNIKLKQATEKARSDIEEGLFDAHESMKQFAEELRANHPTMGKIADALVARAERAAKAEADEAAQSMGAAKRTETLGTKIGDKVQDLADDHAAVKAALDDIDRAFELAQGVAKGVKDFKTQQQLAAMRSVMKRGVVEKGKIAGIKPKNVKLSAEEVELRVGSKFRKYQKAINEFDMEINAILKAAGIDDRNVLSPALHDALRASGTSLKNLSKDLKKDPELGHAIEVNLDKKFEDLIDNLYTKADGANVELFEALNGAYNKIRTDMEWSILAHKDRNAAQIALDPEWSLMSRDFQEAMGGDLDVLDEIYNSGFNKTLRNQFGGFTRSYAGELAASKTSLAQWAALNIFELPGGTGGKIARNETAAISMEMFEAKAVHPVNVAWDKATRKEAQIRGLNMFDSAVMRHSSAAADKNANMLGRKVQLEMNARQMEQQIDSEPHVKAFADELEKSYDYLYKTQFENGVEGITGQNKIKAYMSQSWADSRLIDGLDEANLGRAGMEKLIYKALRNRNTDINPRELDKQVKRTLERMEENIRGAREDKQNIVTDGDYINKRMLHMDLSTTITRNGKEYSLLDFMSNDVVSDMNKYAKKTSATAAISKASNGKLNSADAIQSFIHAVGAESQALGSYVDVGDMTNAFKLMMGEPIKSFDPRARKIRDAVALSGMNGLGESQLAELGLAMNRGTAALFAATQVLSRVKGKYNKWGGIILTPEQAASTSVLKEMQSVSTLYDQMHNLARQNVHFDESYTGTSTSATMKGLNKVVDFGTGGKYRPVLQHVQTKHTGYGSIRTMQEQISMAGLMHDVGRKLSGNKSSTSDARLADIGVPMDLLRQKVSDGTIQLDSKGNIVTLGLETWSTAEQHTLGVALRRHSAQQVQVGFAGETSALMSNPWVAFMMQFRSYPNIAAEKQQMRNAMFHDKEAAMGLTLNAASSMAARVIRYQSLALALPEEKRERYLNMKYDHLAHDTAMYMGGVGTMVNTYDMVQDPSEATPPVFSWANNYRKAVEGLGNGISTRDVSNIMTAVPLGTIAQMNLISGAIKELMETDSEEPTRLTTRNRDS